MAIGHFFTILTLTPALHYTLVRGSSTKLEAIEHSWAIWPLLTLADLCMSFNPSFALHSGQGFFLPNFGSHRVFLNTLTIRLTLYNLWPQQCITLQSWVFPTKFGNHRPFLRQLYLWMTFGRGSFKNMLSNLVGLSPTFMPSFSSIPPSTTKRIAVHTHTPTPPHTHAHTPTYRVHYFSSIDVTLLWFVIVWVWLYQEYLSNSWHNQIPLRTW